MGFKKMKDGFLLGLPTGPLYLIAPEIGKLLENSNKDFSVSTSPRATCASDFSSIKWDSNRTYLIGL